ncbi:MAG: malto-oligosyltrehalose synthase, partial [Myxococcota bacterium]|nr:malto-oligosyltrehalose synthase [Myxococcota bacterium]
MSAGDPSGAARVPVATYRVQLTKDFNVRRLIDAVEYLHSLGITDVYTSPFLVARAGSQHGYDVIDHRSIDPAIGDDDAMADLHRALDARGMGLMVDVVPNHMCVNTNDNLWWNDVLENGPSSPFAKYFDIEWRPPKAELHDKVLLPILGDQYGRVLENAELQLREDGGALMVDYGDRRLPIGPSTYSRVLRRALERLQRDPPGDNRVIEELESIMTAADHLPDRSEKSPEKVRERQREKEIVKSRLKSLLADHPEGRAAFDAALTAINGQKGDPRSFDPLEELLGQQAYRLSFWRVAAEQINYRRFFEINDLAAIRIEEPEVLEAVHTKLFELLRRGFVTALRVDHVDGLREPRQYLADLAERTRRPYVVVEKILAIGERLPETWPCAGTTGYDFLNLVNGLFVAPAGEKSLRAIYDGLRTVKGTYEDVVFESKRLVLQASMSSELLVLARRLERISEQHRWSRDFTVGTLARVLTDTVACFPVYRTYVASGDVEVAPQDVRHILTALRGGKRRSPSVNLSAFDFLGDVLLMHDPDGITEEQRAERRDF